MSLQSPIPANHVWPLSCEPSACHSPCSPLTPITAEDFEQLDISSSHWVPCQCPPKSVRVWLLCLMTTRCGSFVTVKATCKDREGTVGSRSPTLHYLISVPHQGGKGVWLELQTHNDWHLGLQQDRQQFHLDGSSELDCHKNHSRKHSYMLL